MLRFLFLRISSGLVVLILMSVVTFIIIHLPPGDYADQVAANAQTLAGASAEEAQKIAQQYRIENGLDKPLFFQYFHWAYNVLFHLDFGQSFKYNKAVSKLLAERVPRTIGLSLTAYVISNVFGLSLGIFSGLHKDTLGDRISTFISFLGMTVPRFVMALLALYWISNILDAGSTVGSLYSPKYAVATSWSMGKFVNLCLHVWPVIVISVISGMAYNVRMMRNSLLDVLHTQYVETATAKGLPRNRVILRHAVPNALHPIVTRQGAVLPQLIQGNIEICIVLGIPTVGPLLVESVNVQDIYVSASILLILSSLLIVGNILADLLLAKLDPRIRLS